MNKPRRSGLAAPEREGRPFREGGPDVSALLRRLNRDSTLRAGDLFQARGARPRTALAGMLLRPPLVFLRDWVLRRGILGGAEGLNLALLSASGVFWTYAKWWHRSWLAEGGGPGEPWPLRGTADSGREP